MTPEHNTPDSSSDDPTTDGVRFSDGTITALVILIVTLVHVIALVGNRGPVLYSDALGYLGNARFLAGGAQPTFDGSFAYAAGYSLLLVPIYWVTQRSDIVWATAVVLNVALSVMIMVPAWRLGRQLFGLGRRSALLVAAAVSLTPALMLQPGRIWTETLFPFVFLSAAAFAVTMFRTNRSLFALASGGSVGYLVFIHGRGMAVAAAFAIVVLVAAATRRLSVGPAIIAVGTTGAVIIGDLAMRSYLSDRLWSATSTSANAGSASRILAAFSPSELGDTLSTALGHLWYVAAVSFGIAVVGVLALVWLIGRFEPFAESDDGTRLTALFVLISVVGVAALSAGLLSEVNRVDHRVYGRYLEGVTPILILAGGAWLLRARAVWRVWAIAATAIPVAGLLLVAWRGSEQFVGNVQKFAIPGLLGLQTIVHPSTEVFLGDLDIVAISFVAAAAGVALALFAKYRATGSVIAVVAVAIAVTFVGKTTSWDPFVSFWFDAYDNVPARLADLPEDEPITYDLRSLNPDARNLYEFRIAPNRLAFVDGPCDPSVAEDFISSDNAAAVGIGFTLVAADTVPSQALWFLDESATASCSGS
jgi:hypothetical protein